MEGAISLAGRETPPSGGVLAAAATADGNGRPDEM
jgi:hypothetical protein